MLWFNIIFHYLIYIINIHEVEHTHHTLTTDCLRQCSSWWINHIRRITINHTSHLITHYRRTLITNHTYSLKEIRIQSGNTLSLFLLNSCHHYYLCLPHHVQKGQIRKFIAHLSILQAHTYLFLIKFCSYWLQ